MLVSPKDHSSSRPAAVAAAAAHRLLLLLGLLASLFTPAALFSSIGVMQPPDPLVQSHNTLVLNCTLTNQSLPYNASDITFQLGGRTVPKQYVKAVTHWTAELRLPDVNRNISGIHMFCSLPNNLHIAHQVVTVADPPTKPNITGCIVYNWLNMTCYWEPKEQDTGLITTQELFYTLFNWKWVSCPLKGRGKGSCSWTYPEPGFAFALMRVVANNFIESATSDGYNFTRVKQVKPDPVKNLKMEKVTNTTIQLAWQPPNLQKTLRYNITYYSEFTPVKSEFLNVYTNETDDGIVLQDLKPFADYTIEISCIPLIDWKPQGYHSEITLLKQQTKPGVPEKNPTVGPGSFDVNEGRNDRNVTIYWQPVPQVHKNDGDLCYIVECEGSLGKSHVKVCQDQFRATFKLSKEEEYEVTILAESSIGSNSALSPSRLHVPSMKKLPPSVTDLIPVAWNVSHYKISWSPVDGASTYTLFFCKKIGGIRCKEAPNWKVYSVDRNETSVNLAVPSSDYSFAMSVQYEAGQEERRHRRSLPPLSSGMFWSKCVYHFAEKLKTPEKFKASQLQNARSLSVDWSHPGCTYGYIQSYIIYFCLKEKCQETEASVMAHYQENTKVWSEGLEEDKEYYVWMTATSPYSNTSDPTSRLVMTVRRSGLTKGALAGVAVSFLIVSVFIICGICYVVKYVKKKWKRLMDEVPITAPEIERIGQSNLDTEQMLYTGDTMGSSRNCPSEHSGMTRIAENESNALRENSFNRSRNYHISEGSCHERALLMNGSAVHDPGTLTLQLQPLHNSHDPQGGPRVPRGTSHSYYNNNHELRDPKAGQYDSPNSRAIGLELSTSRLNETELGDLVSHEEIEMPIVEDDAPDMEIENSGQSSIASYSLVDQCLSAKTPPIFPTLEEEDMEPPLPSIVTNYNGAAEMVSGKSGPSLNETQCSEIPELSRTVAGDGGYTSTPPETEHSLVQQTVANGDDTDLKSSDSLKLEYVPFPPSSSINDQSTKLNVSSLPGRIPLVNVPGYVALPDEIPSSTGLIFEPPAVVDGRPTVRPSAMPQETDSELSEHQGAEMAQMGLLHSQSEQLSDENVVKSWGHQEIDPKNNNTPGKVNGVDTLANVTLSEHNAANGVMDVSKLEGTNGDHVENKALESRDSDHLRDNFCTDYVTLPPQRTIGGDVKWSALHTDHVV